MLQSKLILGYSKNNNFYVHTSHQTPKCQFLLVLISHTISICLTQSILLYVAWGTCWIYSRAISDTWHINVCYNHCHDAIISLLPSNNLLSIAPVFPIQKKWYSVTALSMPASDRELERVCCGILKGILD